KALLNPQPSWGFSGHKKTLAEKGKCLKFSGR
ncbi:ABC transporter, partial [Yersinia pestis]|nr:ABC transporter [Yersinia pestis]